jgi:hypothetical protein
MTVEASRADIPAVVRTEVAPSVRVTPHGVYIGINAHFALDVDGETGNGYKAAEVIAANWDTTRKLEADLSRRILEIA